MVSKRCWCSALRKTMTIKLWGSTGSFSCGVSSRPLCREFLWSHFLLNIWEVSSRNLIKSKARSSQTTYPFSNKTWISKWILKGTLTRQRAGSPRIFIRLYLSFPRWTTSYEMHLLSFAKKFLMLHVKLSIHIFQGILLPTYSIWMTFLLYVHSSFTYMFIHLRGNFMLYIYSHIFTFIWRTISCCTFIEKTNFVLLIHILKDNFMSYVPILRSVFVPYLTYMHICKAFGYLFNIHMYMVNDFFTPSRYKEIIFKP